METRYTLNGAYEALGLTQIDDFLQTTSGDRKIGATTWMVTEAVLDALQTGSVVVVGRDLRHAVLLSRMCHQTIEGLRESGYIPKHHQTHLNKLRRRQVDIEGGFHIFYESINTIVNFRRVHPGVVEFRDHLWKTQTLRRREGPFSRIEKIRQTEDPQKYDVLDHRDEYLMTVPKSTVHDIIKERPEVDVWEWT